MKQKQQLTSREFRKKLLAQKGPSWLRTTCWFVDREPEWFIQKANGRYYVRKNEYWYDLVGDTLKEAKALLLERAAKEHADFAKQYAET
jgi:hypothetical protein